jgi:hypothetical protein
MDSTVKQGGTLQESKQVSNHSYAWVALFLHVFSVLSVYIQRRKNRSDIDDDLIIK